MQIKLVLKIFPTLLVLIPMILFLAATLFCIILLFNLGLHRNAMPTIAFKIMVLLLWFGALFWISWFLYDWVKDKVPTHDLKQVSIYSTVFFSFFLLLSLLTIVNPENPRIMYIIISLLFFILGGINSWILYIRENTSNLNSFNQKTPITGLVFFLGGLCFIGISFWIAVEQTLSFKQDIFYNGSFIAFILPLFGYQTLNHFQKIPGGYPDPFYINPNDVPPRIRIQTRYSTYSCVFNVSDQEIPIRIPHRYKVGHAFHKLVLEAEQIGKSIEWFRQDANGKKTYIGWHFLTEDSESKYRRFLDPDETFQQNEIPNGATIWVKEAR